MKRQLFKRPTWSSRGAAADASETPHTKAPNITTEQGPADGAERTETTPPAATKESDIFSRSAQSYDAILKDRERQKAARAKRKAAATAAAADAAKAEHDNNGGGKEGEEEDDRRDSGSGQGRETVAQSPDQGRKAHDGQPESKKRRITEKDYANFGIVMTPVKKSGADAGGRDFSPHTGSPKVVQSPNVESPSQRTRSKPTARSPWKPRKVESTPIVLDDEADVELVGETKRAARPQEEPEDELDREFPELAAAARERRRLRDMESKQQAIEDWVLNAAGSTPKVKPIPYPDPTIQILITSPIPDTQPLIVHRKLSQRLQECRLAWCGRQGFSEVLTRGVFLVYKMRKLYDVTTCKSLGMKFDAEGRLVGESGRSVFDSSDDDGRIHVQAVTEDLFAQMKAGRRAGARAPPAGTQHPDEDNADTPTAEADAASEELIRVVLKAKGHKDFRLKVKPVCLYLWIHGIGSVH